MRKIVLPTDFSANSFQAIKFAAELFKYEKCEFFILHAYAEEVYNGDTLDDEKGLDEFKKKVQEKVEESLHKVREEILQLFPNPRHSFQTSAAFGLLVDEVNELVNRENIDVVVTSTRGESKERHLTFGSNSLQVIKYVQCPVLTIPEGYRYDNPKKILFPSDFMLPYQRRELKLIGDLARSFCAEIHLLYVSKFPLMSSRQKDNKAAIEEQFYNVKSLYFQDKKNAKTEAILKYIQEKDMDFLVLVNTRHSYLENILFKSTLDEVGLHPIIPFMVLQNFHRN